MLPSLIAHFAGMGALTSLTHSTTGRSTTMPRHVTQRQAQAVLKRAVKTQFASYGPDFGDLKLDMDWDGHVAIIWEEGPYEWTYHFGTNDVDEELTIELQEFQPDTVVRLRPVTTPKGVFVEPYTTYALCIYPD